LALAQYVHPYDSHQATVLASRPPAKFRLHLIGVYLGDADYAQVRFARAN
jgi:hypothetical protein